MCEDIERLIVSLNEIDIDELMKRVNEVDIEELMKNYIETDTSGLLDCYCGKKVVPKVTKTRKFRRK